jgi:hypothetical protein
VLPPSSVPLDRARGAGRSGKPRGAHFFPGLLYLSPTGGVFAHGNRGDAMTIFDYIGIVIVIVLVLWLLLRD